MPSRQLSLANVNFYLVLSPKKKTCHRDNCRLQLSIFIRYRLQKKKTCTRHNACKCQFLFGFICKKKDMPSRQLSHANVNFYSVASPKKKRHALATTVACKSQFLFSFISKKKTCPLDNCCLQLSIFIQFCLQKKRHALTTDTRAHVNFHLNKIKTLTNQYHLHHLHCQEHMSIFIWMKMVSSSK